MCPWGRPGTSCPSRRLSKISKCVLPRLLSNPASVLGLWVCEIWMPLKSSVSVSYISGTILYANPAVFRAQHPGSSFSWYRTPGLGSVMWGLPPGVEHCSCSYNSVCGSPFWRCGLDYTASLPPHYLPPALILLCFFLFWWILFSACLQDILSWDFRVPMRGGEVSFFLLHDLSHHPASWIMCFLLQSFFTSGIETEGV